MQLPRDEQAALIPTGEPRVESLHQTERPNPIRVFLTCILSAGVLAGVVGGFAYAVTQPSAPPAALRRVVFVFRDAGETYGLLPVAQEHQFWTERGVSVLCLVTGGGTSPLGLSQGPQDLPPCGNVSTLESLGVVPDDGFLQNRSALLSPNSVERVVALLSTPLGPPAALVTGLVSAVQLQLAEAFHKQGSSVAGFDDGFSDWDWGAWPARFVERGCLDALFVTASIVAEEVQARSPDLAVEAVGSPTLAQWQACTRSHSQLASIRTRMFPGLPPARPLLSFYGGYGEGYLESVRLFATCLWLHQSPAATLARRRISAAFVRHPGPFNSSAEEAIFAAHHVNVTIVNRSLISAADLAAISNLTLSHDSTVSVQSLYIGTPSAYVLGTPENFSNVATEQGLIPVLRNVSAFEQSLEAFAASNFTFDVSRLSSCGIPRNSTALLLQAIGRIIGKPPL